MAEGKVEIYNPDSREGEVCLLAYNNKYLNDKENIEIFI